MQKVLKLFMFFFTAIVLCTFAQAQTAIEPFSYTEDFESGKLKAWASYPHFQDTAFDPFLMIDNIVPGEQKKSLVQTVQAYWNEDTYGGVHKLLDLYLVPGSQIRFSYYVKSHIIPESVTLRLGGGEYGKLDVPVNNPAPNRWNEATITFNDVIRSNDKLSGLDRLRIHAVAIFVKIAEADPSMTYFLGVDDIRIDAMRMVPFRFDEPLVHHLTEFKEVIPDRHFTRGERLTITGTWDLDADRVSYTVVPLTDRLENLRSGRLTKRGDKWQLDRLNLSFPAGMYVVKLEAHKGREVIAETEMTLCILEDGKLGEHPRLWFDRAEMENLKRRLAEPENRRIAESMAASAASSREDLPLDMVVFDIDQFPEDYYLEGGMYRVWMDRLTAWRSAVFSNALAYAFFDDVEAGMYAKDVLVRVCGFPTWLHPWAEHIGWHSYYVVGSNAQGHAIGYDLLQPLMTEEEKAAVREGFRNIVILPTHRGYVEDNFVTNNTSNWIAMAIGGSILSQTVIYGQDSDIPIEPYFTGAVLKMAAMCEQSMDPDGAYGEGGYGGVSMRHWNDVLPALERNFAVDLSKPIRNMHEGLIWPGYIRDRRLFQFGDSGSTAGLSTSWWLLSKYRDPLQAWAYNFFKPNDTIHDLIYDTRSVPQQPPWDLNPVRLFRNVGLTTFKSGWNSGDFLFIMKTGSFYNHHHMDQGSFFLSEGDYDFIIDRHPSGRFYGATGEPRFLARNIQAIGHSTILIDNMKQGQRVGDIVGIIPGFEDYGFIHQFLDGKEAAYTSGDIGRVYWGKVRQLRRNVLYLKPGAVLMIDTVTPHENKDVDITLLYQTPVLEDVTADNRVSTISKPTRTLHIAHLFPQNISAAKEEVPHSASVISRQNPLVRSGMLTLSSRTNGGQMVIANFLTTTGTGERLPLRTELRQGHGRGEFEGTPFAYSTNPGSVYDTGEYVTDALALTWKNGVVFAADCTIVSQNGKVLVRSELPMTCEISGNEVRYYSSGAGKLTLGVESRPSRIHVNDARTNFSYDRAAGTVTFDIPEGEGVITIR